MIAKPPSGGEGVGIGSYVAGPVLFSFGTTVAGTSFGAVLGAIGGLPGGDTTGKAFAVAIGLIFLAQRVFGVRVVPPSRNWQVPRGLSIAGRPAFSLIFGVFLGLGIVTIVSSWSIYLAIVGAMAQGSVAKGAAVMGAFGLGRGVPVLLSDPPNLRGKMLGEMKGRGLRRRLQRVAGPAGVPGWIESAVVCGMLGTAVGLG